MKINQWTMGLAAVGVVSLASAVNAEEAKMNAVQTALSSTIISGYVDTSFEWQLKPDKESPWFDSYNGIPFRTGSKMNGFNLNVVKLTIEKPMDESEWASGYKVDLLFGPDAVGYNTSVNARWLGNNDFAIKQAYVALRTPVGNGIDWKVGVFDSILGYESFEAGKNPNFTRSWGYAIEPTEHTGILGSYRVNDNIALAFGVANTLSPGINNRNVQAGNGNPQAEDYGNKTWMASVALTAPGDMGFLSGSTLYAGIVSGFAGQFNNDYQPSVRQDNIYAGATLNTPVTGLKAGVAFDYVNNLGGYTGQSTLDDEYADDAWVIGLYASYQATEKLSLHARGEFGRLSYSYNDPGDYFDSGTEKVWSLTGTAQYDLWKNVISRLEVRWDKARYNGAENFGEGAEAYKGSQDSVGLYANLIYTF
jgi:hypothetical protein